jgi:hypothetical protein
MEACRTERGGYSGPPGEFILYRADCGQIWDVVRTGRPAGKDTWRLVVDLLTFTEPCHEISHLFQNEKPST